MLFKQVLVGTAASAAFAIAQAEEPTRFYGGVGIGSLTLEDSADGLEFDGDDTSFQLFGGYRINKNFAIELGYIDGGSPNDSLLGLDVELDASAFEASLIGIVPVTELLSLHARVGALAWESEVTIEGLDAGDEDGTDLSYGLGGTFRLSPSFDARLEWRAADLDGVDMRLLAASALWRF